MVDRDQVNAMADIMSKLDGNANNITDQESNRPKKFNDPTSKAAQTNAMADVLKKLENSTKQSAETIVSESRKNPDLGFAVNAEKTEAGIAAGRFEIVLEKKTVSEGLNKTFYYVKNRKTNEIIYEDLGLFETAMGVVKHMMFTEDQRRIDRLIELDSSYVGYLKETYGLKKKLQRLDESSTKHEVALAKYSNSRDKLSAVKLRILKAL